jgi:hypothetical protein
MWTEIIGERHMQKNVIEEKKVNIGLTIAIHSIIFVGAFLISAKLAEITGRFLVTWLFILIPAVLFSLFGIAARLDSRQNIMQNLAIVVIAAVYLIVSAIASIVLNCLNVSETLFYSVEIIIMVIGIAAVLWGYRGKRYIEH